MQQSKTERKKTASHTHTKKRKRKEERPCTAKTHNQGKVVKCARELEESLQGQAHTNAAMPWEHFNDTVYNTALSVFGKKTRKSADWFKAYIEELKPPIEEEKKALAAYKDCPSERNLQVLQDARSKVQQTARRCANEYWLQLCSQIQTAAETGNMKGMYDDIKQVLSQT